MKTKLIPVVLLLLLLSVPALSIIHPTRLSDFAVHLREAGLIKLYRTEIRTLCLEYNDPAACMEAARMLVRDQEAGAATAILDSITYRDRREDLTSDLLRARILVTTGEHRQALEIAEAVIDEMPAKDLMVEAILIRAQCQYHLGQVEEALMNLRSIRPFVPEGRDAAVPLYLGLCEEAVGNLEDARELLEEAEAGGSAQAALGILRLALKQGDVGHFSVVADEIGAEKPDLPYGEVCGLAREVEEVLPMAWQALMGPVIADSTFSAEVCPKVVASLVRLAEGGVDVSAHCGSLLARPASDLSADWLRYALAVSGKDSVRCDRLALLSREASDRDLKVRCIAGCLVSAGSEERPMFAGRLLPVLDGLWKDLNPSEQMEMAELLIESSRERASRGRLLGLAEGLRVGHDDAAIFEVATAIERAGDGAEALSLFKALSESPLPSDESLAAARGAYLIETTAGPEEDVAGVVERVVEEGVSPLDLGDLFMNRLKDFKRAASFYRRALAEPPEGVTVEAIRVKLGEALAARSLETGDRDLRIEALGIAADLADTSIVGAGEVLRILEVSTDWLSQDRGRAFEVLQGLGRRQDLRSRDLYRAARLLFHLFRERDGNVYAQCAVTLRRLANEYPTSREAPLGALLTARLKFEAGDYVGALEAYETCREVWRNHAVTPLCEEGIGDCYLYSGGVEKALGRYGRASPSPRVASKIAGCYEITDRPDSARYYYSLASERVSTPRLSGVIDLRLALLTYENEGLDAALAGLDSGLPGLRDRRKTSRRMTAAFALGRSGYRSLAIETLTGIYEEGGESACDALLLVSTLEADDDPDERLALLGGGETVCKSIFGALRLLYERAYLACSSGLLDTCVKERGRYQQRFPLDRHARLGFDVHQALISYREGFGDTASAVIDSLAGGGRKHDALAYGFYRKGIHHMVKRDYRLALDAFKQVEEGYPDSDLYFDTLLKLGTAYYMLEIYDSSAAYFDDATGAEAPSIVENAYFNLGLTLEEAGRPAEASTAFVSMAKRFPFSERFDRALMRAAYTLEQAGRPAEAIPVYRALLQYAEDPATAAETMYWIGESFAEMGEPTRAACEFLRVAHLFPGGGPWAGTAAFRAGMECEKAGLVDHALIVYRENVRKYGTGTDWGRASEERLEEMLEAEASGRQPQPGAAEGDRE